MKNITFIFFLIVSNLACGAECSEQKAFNVGLNEIKKKFKNYKEYEPFKINENHDIWLIYGSLPVGVIGGTPEAIVNKTECMLVKLQHGQ